MILFMKRLMLLFFAIGFFACDSTPNKKLGRVKEIDIATNIKNFQRLSLGQLNAKVEYIQLQSVKPNLIGRILHFDINDNHIAISDLNKVLLFSRSGSFITKVGGSGYSPQEYISSGQIKIIGENVYVPCNSKGVLLKYNLHGEFVSSTKTFRHTTYSQGQSSWGQFDGNLIFHWPNITGDDSVRFWIINMATGFKFHIPNPFKYKVHSPTGNLSFPYPGSGTMSTRGHLYYFKDKLRFFHTSYDTIWQFVNRKLIPLYAFNRGKYGIPPDYLGFSIHSNEIKGFLKDNILIWQVLETSKYIILVTRSHGENYPFKFKIYETGTLGTFEGKKNIFIFYNKESEECFSIAPSGTDYQLEPLGIENDIDGGINFAPMYSPNERTLVSWFNAMDLKAHVASEGFKNSKPKYPEKKRELEALANRLKDTDNPVLMVVTLEE
jgi:hypothetical protein